jgi:hypothetical protein
MYQTLSAEMRNGRIKLLDNAEIPDGARVLVTVIIDNDDHFWQHVSEPTLDNIWDNKDDDIYEKLLGK